MELTNVFRVAAPPVRAWALLTDVELIAPCMPGAQLQEIDGDEYRGIVKVKVGPISAQYKGSARFVEHDEASLRLVLRAEGRETRGQGNASATVTAVLTPDGDGTKVSVVTDLNVTGKVAQFGRGVMADVSAKLVGQFVDCLESKVLAEPFHAPADDASTVVSPSDQPEPTRPAVAPTTSRTIPSPAAEPIDLLDAAGSSVMRRVAPLLVLVALGWLLRVTLRRRSR
ncbi:MAG: SRPBCC family protein [Acidimicrobiales bacterium]|nr:SRPBCC family protein [Acidimicrobiales bacterium]